jgi:transcriptional regulator with XRE-family HTH domain
VEKAMSSHAHARAPRQWLPPEQIETIKRLRAEGRTMRYTAAATGVSTSTVALYAPGRHGKVPNAPLREAFKVSPLSATDVARSLGWWDRGCPDGSRVKRALGLQHENGPRYHTYRKLVDAETVMQMAEAIGVSPWAVLPEEET